MRRQSACLPSATVLARVPQSLHRYIQYPEKNISALFSLLKVSTKLFQTLKSIKTLRYKQAQNSDNCPEAEPSPTGGLVSKDLKNNPISVA